jgi:choline kinase
MRRVLVTRTVILAAGSGSRLDSASSGVPKPLVEVGGVPLIGHALEHARESGCLEAVVVVGYEGERVRAAVAAASHGLRVTFVVSPDHRAPNGVSLLAAAPYAGSRFFLQMVDHVFAAGTLPALVARPLGADEAGRLLVDRAPGPIDLDDATKVRLSGDRVTAIGKNLIPWDAIDAGCFVLTPRVFDALRLVPAAEPCTVSSGMRRLAAAGALGAADIGGIDWVDVDTPADRSAAKSLIERRELKIAD